MMDSQWDFLPLQASKQAEVTKLQEEISKVQHDSWFFFGAWFWLSWLENQLISFYFCFLFLLSVHQLTEKLKKKQERWDTLRSQEVTELLCLHLPQLSSAKRGSSCSALVIWGLIKWRNCFSFLTFARRCCSVSSSALCCGWSVMLQCREWPLEEAPSHGLLWLSDSFQRLQGEKEVLYNDSRSEPR